jgi:hypothetical protein
VTVAGGSWGILHLRWLTLTVSLLVGAWWFLFLVLVPAAWKAGAPEAPADRRSDQA